MAAGGGVWTKPATGARKGVRQFVRQAQIIQTTRATGMTATAIRQALRAADGAVLASVRRATVPRVRPAVVAPPPLNRNGAMRIVARSGNYEAVPAITQGDLGVYKDKVGNHVIAHAKSGLVLARTSAGEREALKAMERLNAVAGWDQTNPGDFTPAQVRAIAAIKLPTAYTTSNPGGVAPPPSTARSAPVAPPRPPLRSSQRVDTRDPGKLHPRVDTKRPDAVLDAAAQSSHMPSVAGIGGRANQNAPKDPGRGGDLFHADLNKLYGYDEKPHVVSKAELDGMIARGEVGGEVFRGIASAAYAEDFRSGKFYAGDGAFGQGTYLVGNEPTPSGQRLGLATARIYSGYTEGGVVRMALRKNARVLDYGGAYTKMKGWQRSEHDRIQSDLSRGRIDYTTARRRRQAVDAISKDIGYWATTQGYDAVRKDAGQFGEYIVLLNRTAVVVQREPVT